MIKLQNMAPEVYYKKSRDFQLFGRLYDLVFNYIKNNTLTISDYTTNTNPNQKLLDLICTTLGFKVKHDYNNEELSALCSIFLSCMKNKGNEKAIYLLLKMICSIQGSEVEPEIEYDFEVEPGRSIDIALIIPSNIKDYTLIRDVLDYILPAGCPYIITSQSRFKSNVAHELATSDTVTADRLWSSPASGIIKLDDEGNIINNNIPLNESGEEDSRCPYTDISTVYSNVNGFNYENTSDVKDLADKDSEKLVKATTPIEEGE